MKPRLNVFVHGECGSGKTSLIKSVVSQSPRAAAYLRDDLTISPWDLTQTDWHNLIESDVTESDRRKSLQFWDLSGNHVLQEVQSLSLTPESIHLLVVDATRLDPVSVADLWRQTICRVPGSEVILVLTKTDRVTQDIDLDGPETLPQQLTREIQLTSEQHANAVKDWLHHISSVSAGARYISHLKGSVAKRSGLPTDVIHVSCKTGKGIRELSRKILQTMLDRRKFPQVHLRARHSEDGTLLEELLDGYRQGHDVLVSFKQFEESLSHLHLSDSTDNVVKTLHDSGAIIDFRDIIKEDEGGPVVCVNPEALAGLATACYVVDSKKTFRIEGNHFWPRQSGFKRPSPNLLSKVIERIPTKGLIRECLFPILWQDLELTEDQTLVLVTLLERLGLVCRCGTTSADCEGLVLPLFPRLSVHQLFLAMLMDTLPDRKPALNWTSKPIEGDLQLGWRYHFPQGVTKGLLKMVLARCQNVTRGSQTYTYQWKYGLLMRISQGMICVMHDRDHVTITCRVDICESAGEREAAQLLWRILLPYITDTTRLIHMWEGLFYKVYLVPDGEAFFCCQETGEEIVLPLLDYFTSWQLGETMTVLCKGAMVKIQSDLLFPFEECKSRSDTFDDWLETVASKQLQYDDATESPRRHVTVAKQPAIFKGSKRRTRYLRKKKQEIKWALDEERESTGCCDLMTKSCPTVGNSQGGKAQAPGSILLTTSPTRTETCVNRTGRGGASLSNCHSNEMATHRYCDIDATSDERIEQVAKVFTASVLANGLLRYIEEESSSNPDWRGCVSREQIEAARRVARVVEDTPYSGLYDVAYAVIQAINSTSSDVTARRPTSGAKPNKSLLCRLL